MRTLATLLMLGLVAIPSPAHGVEQTIYVSHAGTPEGDGTETNPVNSFEAAENLATADTVTVRIKPGTYTEQVNWQRDNTTFVPWDWQPGWGYTNVANSGGYPTFDGTYSDDIGFTSDADQLSFYYVKFTRQVRVGMVLADSEDHYLYGVVFTRIGTYYSKQGHDQYAYAGLYPSNVTNMTVRNSIFKDILNNPGPGLGHEHGIYFWESEHNTIINSAFTNVGGDPIRVRNNSNYNTIQNNTFTTTGWSGYIGDYYCKTTTCPEGVEYASWANVFTGNTLNGPHPWRASSYPFYARFCYDYPGRCSQERISGQ